jgi:deazaflavin-dependent oxidoreductase (nitroreductase family)
MNPSLPVFREPTPVEKMFNRVFGFLIGIGFPSPHKYLLQVRGRKSGKVYSTPINLLEWKSKRLLVAPRGRTQWVRNAEAAGEVTLKKGSTRLRFHLRPVAEIEKPAILKAYLEGYKSEVQRYFPVAAGSPVESFVEVAESYPVFELLAA